jgi:hypothetical protein
MSACIGEDAAMKTPQEQLAASSTPADETTKGVHQAPAAPPKGEPPMSKKEFEAKNTRRLELIDKEFDGGELTNEEERELAQLDEETDRYIDALYPLPFHMLEGLREIAIREGLICKDGISLEGFPE